MRQMDILQDASTQERGGSRRRFRRAFARDDLSFLKPVTPRYQAISKLRQPLQEAVRAVAFLTHLIAIVFFLSHRGTKMWPWFAKRLSR